MATIGIPFARRAWAGRVILATLFVFLACAASARGETIVSLTFDDGIETQVPAASLLEAHGMRGTFYINSGTIESKAYFMSWSQLDAIAAAGHEIGGHTIDHKRLPDLTAAQQRSEVCDDAAALRARGYTITDFAYPFGAGSTQTEVLAALHDCGLTSARKVGELAVDPTCVNCPMAETLPPANPYGIKTAPTPTGPITLADMQSWVTQVEGNGGGWLPIVIHDICDGCTDSSVSAADFAAFLDWMQARAAQGTVVKTVRQALAEGPQFPPPTTAIACNGAACPAGFLKSPVAVSLSATDAGGGLGATRYTLDGSDPAPGSPQYTGALSLSQTTTVKFRTWDLTGNPEPVRTQVVEVDGSTPTAQVTAPADGASQVTGDVTVAVDASDAGSGVGDVELFVDGDNVGTSASTASPYEFSFPEGTLALGTHRLKASVTDKVGNRTTSAQTTFTLTDGLPATTISCDGGACPAGFVKGPVSVALSAKDGGSGLGATRYTLDGSDPTESSPAYAGPFSLSETTTVKFRTWDLAGNAETVRTHIVKLDATAPTAQIASPADSASVTGGVTVEVDAADTGSGIDGVELFLDGDYFDYSRSKASPYEFTIPAASLALGSHRIKALATDALGNRTWTAQVTFKLRDGLPETTIACDGAPCATDFVKGRASVSLAATDGGGGLGATRYTLDGSDPTADSPAYTGPFTLTDLTTVKFRTWDLAGNAEPVKTRVIKLDATAPTAQIASPAEGANVQSDVTVKIDATDAGSGVSDVELFLDGDYFDYSRSKASPYEFTIPAASLALGSHRIKAFVADALGNRTWTPLLTFNLKNGLPETAIACDGAPCPAAYVKGPVSVSLAATDGGGGLGSTRYTLDGSDPTESSPAYAGPFSLSETTTVKFRTWDLAGNAETVRTQVVKLDATAPSAQIASPAEGANVQGDVTVKVDATDTGSGVSDVELFLDGDYRDYSRSQASPYELTLPAGTLALGSHRIKALVTDALGNRTWTSFVTFNLKDGLPETAIACDGAACPAGYVEGPVSVSLAATDGGGGLGATHYTLDGADPDESSPEYGAPFTVTGTTTVKFRTWDAAANAEQVHAQTIKIDTTAPTAQIVSPAGGETLAGDITVKVEAADAEAGIATVDLYVDGDWLGYSRSTGSPYEITVPAGTLAPGAHDLKVVVTDSAGNELRTPKTTITI